MCHLFLGPEIEDKFIMDAFVPETSRSICDMRMRELPGISQLPRDSELPGTSQIPGTSQVSGTLLTLGTSELPVNSELSGPFDFSGTEEPFQTSKLPETAKPPIKRIVRRREESEPHTVIGGDREVGCLVYSYKGVNFLYFCMFSVIHLY